MNGMKTSFQTFTKLSRKPTTKFISPITIRQNVLIRGNMRKCLTCGGVPRITHDGSVTGFQLISKPYNHVDDCSQKGRI